jgi:hypothetical protein
MLAWRARSEYIAKVPPWPSSSANKTTRQYLILTMRVRDQIIMESAPITSSLLGCAENVEL